MRKNQLADSPMGSNVLERHSCTPTFRKHKVKRIKVDDAVVPLYLLGAADAPAEGVEGRHDDAAHEHNQPGHHQDVPVTKKIFPSQAAHW